MKLTRSEVQKTAQLAHLSLTADDEEQLTKQLGDILQYMEKLGQLDTAGVEPFSHAIEGFNSLREDRVANAPDPDAILANAPAKEKTFFRVPKIIE